jgi:hypothetical protein
MGYTISEKWLRIGIVVSLMISTYFVITSAFSELYDPGSPIAVQQYNIATAFIMLTVFLSLPLWYRKMLAAESWVQKIGSMDQVDRNNAIWRVIKPMCITLLFAFVLTVITVIIIQQYNILPNEVITQYKLHYIVVSHDLNHTLNFSILTP